MALNAKEIAFLETQRSAAMITTGEDGVPKAVRVGVALVDGNLWSSGTQGRVRTSRLRRDPRCTLFVFDQGYSWLTLETMVTLLDGPEAAAQNLRLFRVMQNRPSGPLSWFGSELDEASFLRAMADEGRVIYQFNVERAYGLN
jgi:Pyridoxamine 5'-phosphate oxidase